MSETKHTPGPWRLERTVARNEWNISGKLYAGRFIGTARDMEEAEANASLIASAPELLEALKSAEEELRLLRMKDTAVVYDPTLRSRITAAIGKAEGRES